MNDTPWVRFSVSSHVHIFKNHCSLFILTSLHPPYFHTEFSFTWKVLPLGASLLVTNSLFLFYWFPLVLLPCCVCIWIFKFILFGSTVVLTPEPVSWQLSSIWKILSHPLFNNCSWLIGFISFQPPITHDRAPPSAQYVSHCFFSVLHPALSFH